MMSGETLQTQTYVRGTRLLPITRKSSCSIKQSNVLSVYNKADKMFEAASLDQHPHRLERTRRNLSPRKRMNIYFNFFPVLHRNHKDGLDGSGNFRSIC